ncbi:MAG: response regulator transcription factor [Treponema sp.]|jgi:two-component system phosphate regulon response regulator PhoB|nr:response regulator transcription factor [Treponema sp.]
MGAERILIIEDDPGIQEMLKYSFAQEGWKLTLAASGEEGLERLRKDGADCVILDIMLPGMDGFKTLKKIRADESFRGLPVIMCTARGEEADVVAGLELGADDYVVKPYSPRVLAARIRTGLRRKETAASNEKAAVLRHGKLSLDVEKHAAFLGETALDLYATEFAILAQFMHNPDIVFSRQRLITAIRGPDYPVTDRSVDVQILGLRKKLGEAGEMIETIRGVGYRLKNQ